MTDIVALVERLYKLAPQLKESAVKAGRHPWMIDTQENFGNNWLVASFGTDHDGKDYIVTTEYVRTSQYDSDGAKADAQHVALCCPKNMFGLAETLAKAADALTALQERVGVLEGSSRQAAITLEAAAACIEAGETIGTGPLDEAAQACRKALGGTS